MAVVADAFAAGATLVALAFACSTFERWLVHRRRHELAWSVSLLFFAFGSLALWAGASHGWNDVSFRAFYLFGGVVNVPLLALGTVYLLAGTKVGDIVSAVVVLLATFAAGVVTVAPLKGPVAADTFPEGKDLFGVLPRIFAGVGSGIAAMVIIGGALWSAFRLLRGRSRASAGTAAAAVTAPGRLAAANVLIALGTLVISAKALFEGLGDEETAFSMALATGIAIVFVGFLLTTRRSSPPMAVEAAGELPAGRAAVLEASAASGASAT